MCGACAFLNDCRSGEPRRFDDRWLEECVQDGVRGGRSSCSPDAQFVLFKGLLCRCRLFKELKKGTAAGSAATTAVKILEVDTNIFCVRIGSCRISRGISDLLAGKEEGVVYSHETKPKRTPRGTPPIDAINRLTYR